MDVFPRILTREGSAGFKIGLIMSLEHLIHVTLEGRRDEAIVTNRENFFFSYYIKILVQFPRSGGGNPHVINIFFVERYIPEGGH